MPRKNPGDTKGGAAERTLLRENEDKSGAALKELHHLLRQYREKNGATLDSFNDRKTSLEHVRNSAQKTRIADILDQAVADSGSELQALRCCFEAISKYHTLRAERRIIQRQFAIKKTQNKAPSRAGGSVDMGSVRPPLRRGALMMMLQRSAANIPLWIGLPDEKPPELCGCIEASPSYVCPIGAMVAAAVAPTPGGSRSSDTESENADNWILAEITDFSNGVYGVDDIDEEQHEHYKLPRSQVIPLPLWRVNPEGDPGALFLERSAVLALYPQTTCFYKGLIDKRPSRPAEDYLICFEDVTYPGGYSPPLHVPQRYVVKYVE